MTAHANKTTPIRMVLSQIREQNGHESAARMAQKLGVTKAFLNLVEMGRKRLPEERIRMVIDQYGLTEEKAKFLRTAAWLSMEHCEVDVSALDYDTRALVKEIVEMLEASSKED